MKRFIGHKKFDSSAISFLGVFVITLMIKMTILHQFMHIERNLWQVTLLNATVLTAIFTLLLYINPNTYLTSFRWTHLIVTLLIFINTVYYSHFFTIIPVNSVFQIGQLGGVSESIVALIRPLYFLYFMDTLVLWLAPNWVMQGKTFSRTNKKDRNERYALIASAAAATVIISTIGLFIRTEGHLTPQNLGMLNYHLADAILYFVPRPVDPESTEEALTALIEEEDDRRYTGLLEGRNLIVIQAESLQTFVMEHQLAGQDVTPYLNRMIQENTLYFSRFYEQAGWGNTSDAEFVVHNSFYPSTKTFSYRAFEQNDFYTLPHYLKEQRYTTMAFHGNDPDFWNRSNAYPGQGIDRFYSSDDYVMDDLIGMGLSDRELFQQSLPWLQESPKPFYAFYITLTSHHPFVMDEENQHLDLPPDFQDTTLGHYLQSVHYLDREIEYFMESLKLAGLYENSAIIIYGDHQGLDMRNEESNDQVSRFIQKPYKEDEMFRVPLLIHVPGSEVQEEISITGGQIDIFPTVANLMGNPLQANAVMGKDLLNIQEGFVAKQVHVAPGTFLDNEKVFIMSPDGFFENSRAWYLESGKSVPLSDCRSGYERALAEIALSEYILTNNFIMAVRSTGLEGILDDIRQLLELEQSGLNINELDE